MSGPISEAQGILEDLLDDDIIRVRPSDRDRFMRDWRKAMKLLDTSRGVGVRRSAVLNFNSVPDKRESHDD